MWTATALKMQTEAGAGLNPCLGLSYWVTGLLAKLLLDWRLSKCIPGHHLVSSELSTSLFKNSIEVNVKKKLAKYSDVLVVLPKTEGEAKPHSKFQRDT